MPIRGARDLQPRPWDPRLPEELLGILQPEGLGQKEAVLTQFGEASALGEEAVIHGEVWRHPHQKI